MHALYVLSAWIHILSAMVWIGGSAFLALVVVPVLRRPEHRALSGSLLRWTGLRFRSVGWTCLGLMIATGVLNLGLRGYGWADVFTGRLFEGPFGRILLAKLLLVGAILVLSSLHDFFLGPRATRELLENPRSATAARLRRTASWMGRTTLLLGLCVVLAAVALVRGWPW